MVLLMLIQFFFIYINYAFAMFRIENGKLLFKITDVDTAKYHVREFIS